MPTLTPELKKEIEQRLSVIDRQIASLETHAGDDSSLMDVRLYLLGQEKSLRESQLKTNRV